LRFAARYLAGPDGDRRRAGGALQFDCGFFMMANPLFAMNTDDAGTAAKPELPLAPDVGPSPLTQLLKPKQIAVRVVVDY